MVGVYHHGDSGLHKSYERSRGSSLPALSQDSRTTQPFWRVCLQLHVPSQSPLPHHPHQQEEKPVLAHPHGLHPYPLFLLPPSLYRDICLSGNQRSVHTELSGRYWAFLIDCAYMESPSMIDKVQSH